MTKTDRKIIRFWTSHPCKTGAWWIRNFELDESCYEFVLDEKTPDYLFATEHIYTEVIAKPRR